MISGHPLQDPIRQSTYQGYADPQRTRPVGQTRPVGVRRPVAHGTHRTESAGRGTPGGERRLEGPTRSAREGLSATSRPLLQGATQGPAQTPGRKPGQGRFIFRTLPRPDQWTAPPIEVRLPDPVCPRCGKTLQEHRVDFAAVTDIPPKPKPIVQPYCVWVYRCPTCDTTVRAPHSDLAPDQYVRTDNASFTVFRQRIVQWEAVPSRQRIASIGGGRDSVSWPTESSLWFRVTANRWPTAGTVPAPKALVSCLCPHDGRPRPSVERHLCMTGRCPRGGLNRQFCRRKCRLWLPFK